ncbi:hypothetical protein [uncultured Sphingorhabdus sp.]
MNDTADDLSSLALELLAQLMPPKRPIRFIGFSVLGVCWVRAR